MHNFMKAINTLMNWIGVDKRTGDERRVKTSKRKRTRRKTQRRK